MFLGRLDSEIKKMDMVEYHCVFVKEAEDGSKVTDQTHVETADIHIKGGILLGQAIEELGNTCILDHCYAVLTNINDEMVYLTNIGRRKIFRFKGENYESLEALGEDKEESIHRTAIKEINLSFNLGSINMIFG